MAYTKPEINTIGTAISVIQDHTKPLMPGSFDPAINLFDLQPAYDLDE